MVVSHYALLKGMLHAMRYYHIDDNTDIKLIQDLIDKIEEANPEIEDHSGFLNTLFNVPNPEPDEGD